jgi:hypothetical protein
MERTPNALGASLEQAVRRRAGGSRRRQDERLHVLDGVRRQTSRVAMAVPGASVLNLWSSSSNRATVAGGVDDLGLVRIACTW